MHPFIIVKERMDKSMQEVFLAVEKTLITEVTGLEAPCALLAAFYTFNMQYIQKGLSPFAHCWRFYYLDFGPKNPNRCFKHFSVT